MPREQRTDGVKSGEHDEAFAACFPGTVSGGLCNCFNLTLCLLMLRRNYNRDNKIEIRKKSELSLITVIFFFNVEGNAC